MAKRKPRIVPRVFLSHSSQDQWISEIFKEKLEDVGIEVCLARCIRSACWTQRKAAH
jgi:hypothetical protein